MLQYCTGRVHIYVQILLDYTCRCNKCHLAGIYRVDVGNYAVVRVIVSYFVIIYVCIKQSATAYGSDVMLKQYLK